MNIFLFTNKQVNEYCNAYIKDNYIVNTTKDDNIDYYLRGDEVLISIIKTKDITFVINNGVDTYTEKNQENINKLNYIDVNYKYKINYSYDDNGNVDKIEYVKVG